MLQGGAFFLSEGGAILFRGGANSSGGVHRSPEAYFHFVIGQGLWHEAVSVEVNRRIMDEKYDLIISSGQVVPHEVISLVSGSWYT